MTVARRHVYFIAGFDPKGPGHYHALYTEQAALQGRVSGYAPDVGPRRNVAGAAAAVWQVRGVHRGVAVDTTIELLRWDDIVRRRWQRNPFRVLIASIPTTWRFARCGSIARMYALARPPVYTALSAQFASLLALVVALLLGGAIAAGLARLAAPVWLAATAALAGAAVLVVAAVQAMHGAAMTWFLQLAGFVDAQSRGAVPALDARLDAFAARIAARAAEPALDEVLVVGHSVGANLAISALARALRLAAQPQGQRPVLSLLTLGHCVPMLSTLDGVDGFHRDLMTVAAAAVDWVDVASPIDWVAFPLVDPLAGLRPAPEPSGWNPKLVSPRFHALFGAAGYARLKQRRFQVHLQYLMAAELPGAYDYFAISAGSQTLRERFSGEN